MEHLQGNNLYLTKDEIPLPFFIRACGNYMLRNKIGWLAIWVRASDRAMSATYPGADSHTLALKEAGFEVLVEMSNNTLETDEPIHFYNA